jgi:hypothetical protein
MRLLDFLQLLAVALFVIAFVVVVALRLGHTLDYAPGAIARAFARLP